MITVTGAANTTAFYSPGAWKGGKVWVSSESVCPVPDHNLEVMHHNGDDGKHYCPTGFLWCPDCAGVAKEPEPYECNRWGE